MSEHHPSLDIIGAGGFARQLLPLLDGRDAGTVRFVEETGSPGNLGGYPVADGSGEVAPLFVVAISSGSARKAAAHRRRAAGSTPGRLIAETARVSRLASLGEGAIVCDFAVIEPFAEIGAHFHANVRAFVAHECRLGAYVTMAPGAICNGNVHIGDLAYIGSGAVIRQGTPEKPLSIGEGAVIGMGAVVTKDVPAGAVVVGNPARPLER